MPRSPRLRHIQSALAHSSKLTLEDQLTRRTPSPVVEHNNCVSEACELSRVFSETHQLVRRDTMGPTIQLVVSMQFVDNHGRGKLT